MIGKKIMKKPSKPMMPKGKMPKKPMMPKKKAK